MNTNPFYAIIITLGIMALFFVMQLLGYGLSYTLFETDDVGTLLGLSTFFTACFVIAGTLLTSRLCAVRSNCLMADFHRQFIGCSIFSIKSGLYGLLWLGLFLIFGHYLGHWLNKNPSDFIKPLINSDNIILLAISVIIIAPIYEELLFRGIILTTLQSANTPKSHYQKFTPIIASIITSFYFMISHLQYDWYGMGMILLFSLLLCFFKIKTQSILLPILLHSINNTVAFLLILADIHR